MASTMLHEKCCNTVLQIGAPVLEVILNTGVFKNRIAAPVDVCRYFAAVPHTTQQRYDNEAAPQELTCECESVRHLKPTESQMYPST